MRYKIFLSDSIETLLNEQPISVANSYQEACKIIKEYLFVNNFHQKILIGAL